MSTTCSVIIVSYHTGPMLFASIKAALKQKNLAEVIIVDNGNPPSVLARLQQMTLTEPRLVIMTGGGNMGWARACNVGAVRAKGDFLLLLNPECLLPPDALADTMSSLREVPDAVLAGCWLQNPDGSEKRGARRNLLTFKTAFSHALNLYRLSHKFPHLDLSGTDMPRLTHPVGAISSAFMCMRAKNFQAVKGLDDGFFLHGAGMDLCMRVQQHGGKVICVPRVQVTHMPSIGGETSARVIEWSRAKGLMRYFRKHLHDRRLLPVLWLTDFVTGIRLAWNINAAVMKKLLAPNHALKHTVAEKRLMALALGLSELPEKKDWQGKTVLVTGATSQVGLCVVKRLIASGAAVLAVSRGSGIPFRHEQLRWIKGDLTDKAFSLQGYLVDVVVHCAPLWQLSPHIDLLADAEVKRVIAFGSTSIFGKALSRNPFEKDIVNKLSKAEMELSMRCESRKIQWTLLRPTLVYGLGLDLSITSLARFIDRFGFIPTYPPTFGRRQPVHADDLAAAVMQAVESPNTVGKSYNVSGGEIVVYRQMLERLFTACGRRPCILDTTLLPLLLDIAGVVLRKPHINGEIARRMNDDLVFFHEDAARDFHFKPRPFLSGGLKDIEGF